MVAACGAQDSSKLSQLSIAAVDTTDLRLLSLPPLQHVLPDAPEPPHHVTLADVAALPAGPSCRAGCAAWQKRFVLCR
jgi:hypothetical protein